jgi:hypothetical protein
MFDDWRKHNEAVHAKSKWLVDSLERLVKGRRIKTEERHCPECGGPADGRFADLVCESCWKTRGTMGQLRTRYSSKRERDCLVNEGSWAGIQHWSCQLFGHRFFGKKTLECVENWLMSERQLSRAVMLQIRIGKVAILLEDAVENKKGNTSKKAEVKPQHASRGTLSAGQGKIELPPKSTKASTVVSRSHYRTITEITCEHSPTISLTYKRLIAFLKANQQIRRVRPLGKNGKPRANRQLVHLEDWESNYYKLLEWDKAHPVRKGKASKESHSDVESEEEQRLSTRTPEQIKEDAEAAWKANSKRHSSKRNPGGK